MTGIHAKFSEVRPYKVQKFRVHRDSRVHKLKRTSHITFLKRTNYKKINDHSRRTKKRGVKVGRKSPRLKLHNRAYIFQAQFGAPP